jgi:glycosyltransferase involved in cell wall biosynthesis
MLRVSVLMPMRNTEQYVRDGVMSVLNQEECDLELVVVDDGSTDRSRAVVEGIMDQRVRLLAGPSRGVSAAWNTALASAKGDIVMQCDSDDLYPPGRIAWQLDFLDRHSDFGAVCGGFSTMEPTGRKVADLFNPGSPAEEITKELLSGTTRTSLCTFAVRRKYLEMIGGKREYFESAEDIDFQLRLAEVCRVWFEPRPLYRYRLHDGSIAHSQASERRKFYEEYARELRAQRALGNADDLDRCQPREPPDGDSSPDLATRQIQGFLIREAWLNHKAGRKATAIRMGVRALSRRPQSLQSWKSLAALILKPSGDSSRRK